MARKSGWSIPPSKLYAEKVEELLTRQVRVIAFTAFDGIIRMSPVRTGRYRSNHILSVGEPDYSTTDATSGPTQPNLTGIKPYTTIFISNSLPYAEVLERGNETHEAQNIYSKTYQLISEKFKNG